MIKCDGFGKLLKLSFFGLLTSFFTLFVGSSASAGTVQTIGLESNPSSYNSQYTLTFLKGGGVLTQYLGQGKGILALNSNVLFWWFPNGKPYFYSPSFQGFFDSYYSCDEITGSISYPTNCSKLDLDDSSIELFKSFFSKVYQNDYAYYNYDNIHGGQGCSYAKEQVQVCFSSHEIGNSLCFAYLGGCHYGCQGGANYCTHVFGGGFTGSQSYSGLTFGNISMSSIGYAPGQVGYMGGGNIEGSSNISENTNITGNVLYSTCTNGYILSQAGSYIGSNAPSICYAGIYDTGFIDNSFNGVGSFPGVGLTFKDVYRLSDSVGVHRSYIDWFNSWSSVYYKWYLGSYGTGYIPFLGQPISLFTYFSNLYDKGLISEYDGYFVLNYCNLLDKNPDEPYSGTFFRDECNKLSSSNGGSITTGIVGDIDSDEILPPGTVIGGGDGSNGSSGVAVSVDWSGTLSGDTSQNFDGKTFINDFYQKLQSNFQNPNGSFLGFLPGYIWVFLCAIVLFKFIRH